MLERYLTVDLRRKTYYDSDHWGVANVVLRVEQRKFCDLQEPSAG